MNQKELKELIEFLIEKDISEFELEQGDVKVRIKRGAEGSTPVMHYVPVPGAQPSGLPQPAAHAGTGSVASPPAPAPEQEENLQTVKSPIVGTFYESPSPGSPAFVKIGDQINVGQVLCIIEAMKLMNEIESEHAGEIVKRLVSNGQPVEYGQPLFLVRGKG